jgi:hypothetical protein
MASCDGYNIAGFDKIAPVLQLIVSHRQPERGAGAFPNDTGYDRLFPYLTRHRFHEGH